MDAFRVSEALASIRRLRAIGPQMTEDEVLRAIALEEESLRRKSVLDHLQRLFQSISRKKEAEVLKAKVAQQFSSVVPK